MTIKVPNGYMNIGVSTSNCLVADTNDSSNWNTFKTELPSGEWKISNIDNNNVVTLKEEGDA